jgi:hypothetical protein
MRVVLVRRLWNRRVGGERGWWYTAEARTDAFASGGGCGAASHTHTRTISTCWRLARATASFGGPFPSVISARGAGAADLAASERTVVVLSNAPHLKARVAALVKGAEGRGFRLASSEVVRDTGGGDPVIVMVWEGKGVVKAMDKLNGAGQEEYVPARSARTALTFPGYVAGLWRVRARGCIHTEGRLPPGRTPPHPGTRLPLVQAGAVHFHVTRQCAR